MIGDILKELREEKKVKQEEIALLLNVERQTVSRYELDLSDPSLENLIKIANYFDVTTDYLLGRTKERNDIYKKLVYEIASLIQQKIKTRKP